MIRCPSTRLIYKYNEEELLDFMNHKSEILTNKEEKLRCVLLEGHYDYHKAWYDSNQAIVWY